MLSGRPNLCHAKISAPEPPDAAGLSRTTALLAQSVEVNIENEVGSKILQLVVLSNKQQNCDTVIPK